MQCLQYLHYQRRTKEKAFECLALKTSFLAQDKAYESSVAPRRVFSPNPSSCIVNGEIEKKEHPEGQAWNHSGPGPYTSDLTSLDPAIAHTCPSQACLKCQPPYPFSKSHSSPRPSSDTTSIMKPFGPRACQLQIDTCL